MTSLRRADAAAVPYEGQCKLLRWLGLVCLVALGGALSGWVVTRFGISSNCDESKYPDPCSFLHWLNSTAVRRHCVEYETIPWTPREPRPFRIDAVITWVDSEASQWQQLRAQWTPREKMARVYDAGEVRFPLQNYSDTELCFAIEGLIHNAPWVHTVWVVVARPQGRDWFTQYPKLRVVYHDELWPDAVGLPSFNSKAIETVIHRVPGLAEHYIYLNDDFYMLRPMYPAEFFTREGRPISIARVGYFDAVPPWMDSVIGLDPIHSNAWRETSRSLRRTGVLVAKHAPMALTRSLMNRTAWRLAAEFAQIRSHRFRDMLTLYPLGVAINSNGLVSGHSRDTDYVRAYECSHLQRHLPMLAKSTPTVLCVNNCRTKAEYETLIQVLRPLLRRHRHSSRPGHRPACQPPNFDMSVTMRLC